MKHLACNGEVVLKEMSTLDPPSADRSNEDVPVVVLDVETTGLNHERDQVIQVGLRPFLMNKNSGEISLLKKSVSFLQQPQHPLPDIIKDITGFEDKDLHGHSIPWNKVSKVLNACHFIICHNVDFDKKWVENELRQRNLPIPKKTIWACSMSQIDWTPTIRCSKALEVLCAWHGFFYDAHNAIADVDATLHLLRKSGKLLELITNSQKSEYQVFAANSMRNENHLLKARRYRWNPDLSAWWKGFMDKKMAENEAVWLAANLKKVDPQIFEISAEHRFSS